MYEEVYRIVSKIPMGKVTTYGEIGKKVKNLKSLARVVGNALHRNSDPYIPCHRVVDRNGRLAQNYAFGGLIVQREKLLAERVRFKDEKHVDLAKCLWQGNPSFVPYK